MLTDFGKVLDYSDERPDLAVVKSRGYIGLERYYGGHKSKRLTLTESQDILGHGLNLGTVFETAADEPLHPDRAPADVGEAVKEAIACQQPPGTVIKFACDRDPTGHEGVVQQYYATIHDLLLPHQYLPGFYGQVQMGTILKNQGLVWKMWGTVAWSHRVVTSAVDMLQLTMKDLGDCDVNQVYSADYGAWSSVSVPNPPLNPILSGDDVSLGFTCKMKVGHIAVTPEGEVDTFGGAEYLGGLNNHPEFRPAQFGPQPIVGVVPDEDGVGYIIVCRYNASDGAKFSNFGFPSDGSYR